ncbi:TPA: hypothetical protein HA265_04680 [Candidatus Woesearchaeota archaeon]|nr:hypothetical protein [Candidatus Woesearchaeota archaeon]
MRNLETRTKELAEGKKVQREPVVPSYDFNAPTLFGFRLMKRIMVDAIGVAVLLNMSSYAVTASEREAGRSRDYIEAGFNVYTGAEDIEEKQIQLLVELSRPGREIANFIHGED